MPDLKEGRPISDLMGLELRGWDLNEPLTDSQVQDLCGLLYRHALLCFRDQELTPACFANFGARFGKPILHNEENLRLEGTPCVMSLSNADDRDDRQLNGGGHWHTDLVHTDDPASFTMLNAVAVPKQGGGTMFADQVAAYEALSESRRRDIDGHVVIHCYEGRTDGSMPTVSHPLVRRHPVTGQKALYGAWDTGIGVVGMPDDEGRQFLQEIARHATSERFVYLHRYSLNDLVIWDNALLLHSAEKLERARDAGERRMMHRVSVHGWPAAA
jgi:taurine dioxygenase